MVYELPKLGYEYDSLEPFIDSKTMEIHHSKHHAAYIQKLNAALENYPELQDKNVEELLKNLNNISETIRKAVRNHGGGHWNHSFFWKILKKNVNLSGEIKELIEIHFENYDGFKKQFSEVALNLFGSGWVWLVLNNNKLEIVSTINQDCPISEGKIPLIGIDLWEHAYYLKYQNKRAEYIEAFFNVINWNEVNNIIMNA